MTISTRQQIVMAALVVFGVVAGAAVLTTGREKAGEQSAPPEAASAAAAPASGASAAHEARTVKLDPAQLKRANIGLQAVGPGLLQGETRFQGEVRFNEDRTAHVVPRLAGVAEAVPANLGQSIRK